MTVKPKPLSRPWWNHPRFSLRALMVLVLLIGAGLGWLVRSAHVQRDAVAAVRRAGGSVSIDLTGTEVTLSGVQELQKELPNAQILP